MPKQRVAVRQKHPSLREIEPVEGGSLRIVIAAQKNQPRAGSLRQGAKGVELLAAALDELAVALLGGVAVEDEHRDILQQRAQGLHLADPTAGMTEVQIGEHANFSRKTGRRRPALPVVRRDPFHQRATVTEKDKPPRTGIRHHDTGPAQCGGITGTNQ
ncbi:MAG: hypothetical protein H7A53_08905 [Akkermansiaceae bacterium]|nr:hypothetical protein [Akkermansiaceae bacterium]